VETNKYPQDSVAIVVTWALYELVRHSAVLRQLRAEISKMQVFFLFYYGFMTVELTRRNRVGPSDPPSSSQLEGMEFLNGVVQETMRVHASGMADTMNTGNA
jgi:cytochrome P450